MQSGGVDRDAAMAAAPSVSALVVSFNTRELLATALASLREQGDGLEVVLVDNASEDGSADLVEAWFPEVRLVRAPTNLGFAAGVNRAARAARGHDLLLFNPDAELAPGALAEMRSFLQAHRRVGAVGASLVYGDGTRQQSAFRFPGLAQVILDLFPVRHLANSRLNGRYPPTAEPIPVDHPLGACMLIRREAWDDVGALDEGYFVYVEEVDWCRRARARGWEVWLVPRARAVHHGGGSTRQHPDAMLVQLWRSRLRYYERFHGPLYNRVVRLLVRTGMDTAARRACGQLQGAALETRLAALAAVRQLAS